MVLAFKSQRVSKMAYSRWGVGSPWYCFWNTSSGNTKETQILSLWYSADLQRDWTYEELMSVDAAALTIEYAGVPHDHILLAMDLINTFKQDVERTVPSELGKHNEPRTSDI